MARSVLSIFDCLFVCLFGRNNECLLCLVNGFLGKSLVNGYTGTGCQLFFTGCDTGATYNACKMALIVVFPQ